jgi:hypothetical protein
MSLSQPDADSGSSPIKRSIQSSLTHQSSPESSAKDTQLTMEKETRGHWIGPMPVARFLDEFLPIHHGDPPPPSLPYLFSTLLETKIENQLYDPFVRIVSVALLCTVRANQLHNRSNSYLKITTSFVASRSSIHRTTQTSIPGGAKRSSRTPPCTNTMWTPPQT